MTIDYYEKYLKYKAKYLALKNQMGGGYCRACKDPSCKILCKFRQCQSFRKRSDSNLCKCGHSYDSHRPRQK